MVWGQIAGAVAGELAGKLLGGGGTSLAKQTWAADSMMRRQLKYQEEYDSRTIQRRVADAKAAGVSTLAALGMSPSSGASFSPIQPDFQSKRGSSTGESLGRAVAAAADPMARLQLRLANAEIEGQELDNEYKRSQLRQASHVGPSMPGIINDGSRGSGDGDFENFDPGDGRPFKGPNARAGQMIENSPAHGAGFVLRDLVNRLGGIARSYSSWRNSQKDYYAKKSFPAYKRQYGKYRER